jgi:hypothetical protein
METPRTDDCYVAGCGKPRVAWARTNAAGSFFADLTYFIPLCEEHADLLEKHMDEVWREP